MSEMRDRMKDLTPEQRALLERKLRERGLDPGDAASDDEGGQATSSAGADPDAWRTRSSAKAVDFSIYFFSDDGTKETADKYELVLQSARFADEHGFAAVWTPERHFQSFGGLYPNPSVLGAALAAITRHIGIRAGSVALPLHNPIRVAEEWAVVDNLSNGRAGVSFASGWHPDDFVLYPTPYDERKEIMFQGIETLRRLWSGEAVARTAPNGAEIEVRTYPRPIQPELPIWITTAGNPATWERAGSIGAHVLGALVGYTPEDLTEQIDRYRAARAQAGHDPAQGRVTLVAHTFVGTDDEEVRELVRKPMARYLETYLKQFQKLGLEATQTADRDTHDIASLAFQHYFETSTLLGTQGKCARVVDALARCGADEVACLIDFGLETEQVLAALPRLAELREHYGSSAVSRKRSAGAADTTAAVPVERTGP